MRPLPVLSAALLAASLTLPASAQIVPAQTAPDRALTIYSRNFAVVRRTVPLSLTPGLNHVSVSDITFHLEPENHGRDANHGRRNAENRELRGYA